MQTFLPYKNYQKTAEVLDMRRLGKQRVETLQILKALSDPSYGWQHHPAVNMWRNHEIHLIDYGVAICDEWISRSYKDTCREKISYFYDIFEDSDVPPWYGDERVHSSHRAALYKKASDLYPSDWEFDLKNYPEYWWPAPTVS
jgi:hypothetical protein